VKTVETGSHITLVRAAQTAPGSGVTFDGTGSGSPETDVQAELDRLEGLVGAAAPDDADYLVGTAQAGLSAEIVVGTTPGGELGGTWASPTVDATHSGTSHADAVAAAIAASKGLPLGLTGATAATRYVGATVSGAPVAGTFAVGDFIIDQTGFAWVCTVAGTPGTWVKVGGASGNATGQFTYGFDAGAFILVAGKQQDIIAPYTGTITGWTILTDQSGAAAIDIWKNVYGSFPPTIANTITGSAKPTLSGANKATSTTLTGWTTAVTAGDILRANLDSTSTLSRLLLVIAYSRP